MQYTDLLTIAIPVFERKDFFLESMESALNQTVKCKIIVIDNGSSHDLFRNICLTKEVDYYKNESNIGLFPNWNRCFELANTPYVMILGDDDILDPEYVSSFIDAKSKNKNIDLYFSDFEILDNKTKELKNHGHVFPFGYLPNGNKVVEYGIKHRLGFPIITSAILKEKFTGFYEEFHASNDWAWLYENVNNFSVYGENRKLLKYRSHQNNERRSIQTAINCQISIWYIYKILLSKNLNVNKELSFKLNNNIKVTSIWVISHIEKEYYNSIITSNNRYSVFLKNECEANLFYKQFLFVPLFFRLKIYKVIKKLNLIE